MNYAYSSNWAKCWIFLKPFVWNIKIEGNYEGEKNTKIGLNHHVRGLESKKPTKGTAYIYCQNSINYYFTAEVNFEK